ncbi:ATP-binding cassette, subfamily B [Ruminococcus sp. YE71]|uniref:ABC transporter ATP-binding protein n=1 Tax=unclassified Ruminococcus TaxID=2608920 RepID=UPI00088F6EC0|nr:MULTISPECIES: ABC transporter ATP-binding protein [unclassified Ruminococcus]SDA10268.1 ATP-binding cassette, subfamily B [Ruminococcus sp. YE78]SFW10883.1 ATP-binding cassette, subfamily B [Ruminococcus sp. YE71]
MIKKFASCIREYKRDTILTPLFVMLEVILECIIPLMSAKLVNALEKGTDMGMVVKYGIVMLVMAFASLGCGALSGYYCARASCGFAKNLRHDLFYKVQDFSFANIDKFSTSSLVTRLTTDVTNIQNAFMMIIRVAVRCPFMLIFALAMATYMAPSLSVVYLMVLPLLVIGMIIMTAKALPLFNRLFKKYDALNESVQENVSGIRVVKAFVRERYEIERFNKASQDLKGDFTGAEKILAFNAPLMQFCIHLTMLGIGYLGAKQIVGSGGTKLNVGNMQSMITYSMQILMSLMFISMIFVMVTMSIASAKRVAEVLDDESTIKNPDDPVMEVRDGSIDFNNVKFAYSAEADKNVLENIDLHIKSGQTIGVIGGTGSSKSSLIQLIPRLYDVTGGELLVGGVDVRNYDLNTLRGEVSVVLQKNVLFSGTVKENLRWGDENATDEDIERVCKLAQADEFIQRFPDKYDTHIEQGGTNVSGGQKQRLCIARALLGKPKILILDDSTSAVDTKTDALIRKAFAEEIPDTTKIIIAQRISSVQDADQIIVLEGGHINAVGTHEQLLETNEIYKEVYTSQNKQNEEVS